MIGLMPRSGMAEAWAAMDRTMAGHDPPSVLMRRLVGAGVMVEKPRPPKIVGFAGLPVVVDETMEPGTFELRGQTGEPLLRVVNVGVPVESENRE